MVDEEFITIPAGEFVMGAEYTPDWAVDTDYGPAHPVWLSKYQIQATPVTLRQWTEYLASEVVSWNFWKEVREVSLDLMYPITYVSWHDAKGYCDWRSRIDNAVCRLPTEAEWEKAARGTDGRRYPWGNEDFLTHDERVSLFSRETASRGESGFLTIPVGTLVGSKSPYGCFDMCTNVSEWCYDWLDEMGYEASGYKNPVGPREGSCKAFRGKWGHDGCEAVVRKQQTPDFRHPLIGFRMVREVR